MLFSSPSDWAWLYGLGRRTNQSVCQPVRQQGEGERSWPPAQDPWLSLEKMAEPEEDRDQAGKLFGSFIQAYTCKGTLQGFNLLCRQLDVDPLDHETFYSSLKAKLTSWRAKALWSKLDKRTCHKEYRKGQACLGTRVTVRNTAMGYRGERSFILWAITVGHHQHLLHGRQWRHGRLCLWVHHTPHSYETRPLNDNRGKISNVGDGPYIFFSMECNCISVS